MSQEQWAFGCHAQPKTRAPKQTVRYCKLFTAALRARTTAVVAACAGAPNTPSQRTAHSNVPATNAQVPNAGNQQRTSVEVMHGWLGCVDSLDPPPNPPHWVRHTTGSRELPQGPAMAFAHNTGNTQTPLGEEPNAIAPALGVLSEENNTYIQNG